MPKLRKPAKKRSAAAPRSEAGDVIATLDRASVTLSLHEGVYPLASVHGAAYLFLPRVWLRLDRDRSGRLLVRLSPRPGQPADRAALEALAGEFANELTNQYVREQVAARTTRVREAVVGRALLGALGTGDELSGLGGDAGAGSPFDADPDADPLGIAQDWEIRFGRPADKDPTRARLSASDPNRETKK